LSGQFFLCNFDLAFVLTFVFCFKSVESIKYPFLLVVNIPSCKPKRGIFVVFVDEYVFKNIRLIRLQKQKKKIIYRLNFLSKCDIFLFRVMIFVGGGERRRGRRRRRIIHKNIRRRLRRIRRRRGRRRRRIIR